LCITGMYIWEKKVPGGTPRRGILGLDTTRGDRLFVSLLGSAFIHLAWLGLTDMILWIASVISVIYAIIVFRYV
jgi:predicted small integral membrane protein